MKILVFSDSHGYCDHMLRAIENERPDRIIHLGDHVSDAEHLKEIWPSLPMMRVRGNCDRFDVTTPEYASDVCDGVRIFAVHGHRFDVKRGLLRLFMAAKERAVHIALFGHTHCAFCENKENIWLLNPGSCGYMGRGSYGVIMVRGGSAECAIKTICEREEEV